MSDLGQEQYEEQELNNSHLSFDESDKDREEISPNEVTPWLTNDTKIIKNPQIRLHNEIVDFFYYIKPKRKEHNEKVHYVKELIKIVEDGLPGCKMYPHGSFITELYIPNSDIDLVIIDYDKDVNVLISDVKNLLRNYSNYKDIRTIKNAKVPLIKFYEESS